MTEEFNKYISSDTLSVEEYNLQWVEIDAHAFGAICMVDITHCKPLWNGFSDELKGKIEQRIKEIAEESNH